MGRTSFLELTCKGQAFAKERIAPVIEAERKALAKLDKDEMKAFARLYRAYASALSEEFSKI